MLQKISLGVVLFVVFQVFPAHLWVFLFCIYYLRAAEGDRENEMERITCG